MGAALTGVLFCPLERVDYHRSVCFYSHGSVVTRNNDVCRNETTRLTPRKDGRCVEWAVTQCVTLFTKHREPSRTPTPNGLVGPRIQIGQRL